MNTRNNALITGLTYVCLVASVLQLQACASRSTHSFSSTTYCAELKGIRAVKGIGCKEDNIGRVANTPAANTNIEIPH